jgi:hypothetical protein
VSTVDPFLHTLEQIQPLYFELQTIMEIGVKVRARMHRVNLSWRVRIEEDWDSSPGELYYEATYLNLDTRCEWTAEQLKTWKSATRLSHQEWKFSKKKDAEKFITLFNLVWAI